jgi:hypothetical protein
MAAVAAKNFEIVKYLMDNGAKRSLNATNNHHLTATQIARIRAQHKIAAFLERAGTK